MNRKPITSSRIASVGYDPKKKILEVEFAKGGQIYQYHPITEEGYIQMMKAESVGIWFQKNIVEAKNITTTKL